MNCSESDILREVGAGALAAGRTCQRQARVVVFEWQGGTIVSQVKGSQGGPYRQTISIHENRKGRIAVEGLCTCPVGYNCKHVAASLLHGLQLAKPGGSGIAVRGETVLSADVADWLDRLRRIDDRSKPGAEDVPQRLVYILSPDATPAGIPRLRLEIRSVRLLKDGTLSKTASVYNLDNWQARAEAKFLREADRHILHGIVAAPRGEMRGQSGEAGCGNQQIKAITGHKTDKEVARYTAAADQVRLADQAMLATYGAYPEQNLATLKERLDKTPDNLLKSKEA